MSNGMKLLVVVAFLGALLITGCVSEQRITRGSETHFAFPNSNVTPLAPVHAEVTGGTQFLFFGSTLDTGDRMEEVRDKAVASVAGADIVTDYVLIKRVYSLLGIVKWAKYEVQGTAARMDIGSQEIR